MSVQSDGGQPSPDMPVKAKRRLSGKWLLLTLVLVLVVIIAGAWLYMKHDTGQKAAAPAKPKTKFQQLGDDTTKMDQSGDYQASAQKIEAYLATKPGPEEEKKLTFTLASTYLNANQPQKALEVYKRIRDYGDQYAADSYHGQAFAYEQMGDKPNAIAAYKKAIEVLQASHNPRAAGKVKADQASVERLGGTP